MAHRVTLLALDDCFASNVIGTMDMLGTANLVAGQLDPPRAAVFEWQVLSVDGEPVRASNGHPVAVDGAIEGSPPASVIVIPAFGSPRPEEHIAAIRREARLLPWLRTQYANGTTLASTCSASFLLAESGLLDGRPATTSWWLAPAFAERYPNVHLDISSMLTHSDRLVCAGTGMSWLDLTLHLIEQYGGRDLARLCARYTVLDSRRRSQAPYIILNHARRYHPVVVKAERWIKANLHRELAVEDIAAEVAVSPRTLSRHFRECTGDSPSIFVQKLRVETGKALLEGTRLRLDAILERVGYRDDSAFRRLFKRYTGLSPRQYRERFGIDA